MDRNEKANITIGVGVTTTPNRKHLLDEWLINFRKHTKEPYHLHVHEDINYRGVAYSKNENLKALKDCDYIFLFDDDCYPINDDWYKFFIGLNENHLLYMETKIHGTATMGIKMIMNLVDESTMNSYENCLNGKTILMQHFENCGGVFMMLTKEVVDKVGAFGNYGQYGFEHAGYSQRVFKAGLTTHPYICANSTNKYIKALDYEGKIQSSVSDEVKQREIDKNRIKFIEEVNSNNYFVNFV